MSRYKIVLALLLPSLFADDLLSSGATARAVAAGGTYLSSSDNVQDSLALNPAGLTHLTRPVFSLDLLGVFARGAFHNSANPSAPLESNGALPFGAFGTPLTRRISIGIAILPQLLSDAKWRYTDSPGGVGGVSYGTGNQRSKIVAVRSTVGVGYEFSPKVRLGFTVSAVYNTNTLQTAYVFQSHPALAGLKTLLDLHTSGVGGNGGAGILIQPTKRLEVGAAYQSRTTIASKGSATGNAGIQFAAIGLAAARPDFHYDAEVDNTLPQTFLAHATWDANSRTRISAMANWTGWHDAFTQLPVLLSHGNNADINGLLGTTNLNDSIPLHWKDQYTARIGIERQWRESTTIRFGYAHSNSPIPNSTLMPLTAAITHQTASAGLGYRVGSWRIDAAYNVDPTTRQQVENSAIKAGEYNNSSIRVSVQSVLITITKRL